MTQSINAPLAERIIPRLSYDERRVMAMPTVQLAMLGGDKGITIEKHDKVPTTTVKSLIARGLARAKIDNNSRVMPLSGLGVQVNEALLGRTGAYLSEWELSSKPEGCQTWPCGHPRTVENTQSVGVGNGVRCRLCRRAIARRCGSKVSVAAA